MTVYVVCYILLEKIDGPTSNHLVEGVYMDFDEANEACNKCSDLAWISESEFHKRAKGFKEIR